MTRHELPSPPLVPGDMQQQVYDTDADGRVDKAEALDDGTNVTTAAQARSHIDATSGVHGVSGEVVGTSGSQTLSSKTLSLPFIGSFTNAAHDHSNAAGGGALGDGSVALTKIEDATGLSVPARISNTSGPLTFLGASLTGHVLRRSGAALAWGQLEATSFPNDLITDAMLANMAQSTVKMRAAGAGTGDPIDGTMVQLMAAMLGISINYAQYYGGVVTLAVGSDTVLGLGTTVLQSANYSIASNVVTVAAAETLTLVWFSSTLEGTVAGDAQVSIQLEQDPNTGSFVALAGTRKDGHVHTTADGDRTTLAGLYLVVPGASYKYRLTGRVQSTAGGATVKTVTAGTSLMLFGLSNA